MSPHVDQKIVQCRGIGQGCLSASPGIRRRVAFACHASKSRRCRIQAIKTTHDESPALLALDKGTLDRKTSRRAAISAQLAALTLTFVPSIHAEEKAGRHSVEELKQIVAHDFQHNQYYVTGKLTRTIFTSDCAFVDPTTRVEGVEKYSNAVALLFDDNGSRADLISIEILDPQSIKTKWRFAASLNIPGKPKLKPYTGTTVYSINTEGLIYQHKEEWDISALDAFVSILFPSFGAQPAPPVSNPIDI